MKKLNYFIYSALSGICMMSLAACSEEDFGYDKEEIAYETHFVKEFGKPDPNHKWGFIDQPIANMPETRIADTNGNEWGGYARVPEPLTQSQINFVTNWFATTNNPTSIAVNWTEYFAQQVSSTSYGNHMDYVNDAGHGGTDHINNFNNGTCSENGNVWDGSLRDPNDQNSKIYHSDRIQYMKNQSTKDFSYHETMSAKTWADHYVIIPGETIDPTNSLAATGESIWGMFFLGFDYEAAGQSANQIVPRDYYFNDWIIKITPALRQGYPQSVRVMCEDLGGTFDWDFNDVVFDVSFEYQGADLMAIITLQCVGGTLPIKVGSPNAEEAHAAFGKNYDEIIFNPTAPVIYSIKVSDIPGMQYNSSSNVVNAKNIPIYVNGTDLATLVDGTSAPQKFACPDYVDWAPELTNICTVYSAFPTWVQDPGVFADVKEVWIKNPKHQQNTVVEQ